MSNLKPFRAKLFSEPFDSTLFFTNFYARFVHLFWRNPRVSIRLFDDLLPRFRLRTHSPNSTRRWPSAPICMGPHTHRIFLHDFARGRLIFFQSSIRALLDPSIHALLVHILRRHATRLSSWEVQKRTRSVASHLSTAKQYAHAECTLP